MQKIIVSIFLQVLFFCCCFGQQKPSKDAKKEKKPLNERIYFGGNLGLQFGAVTFIDASPLVGYKFTDDFSAGIGLTYIYIQSKNYYYYTTNIYGGRVFARYNILENLFLYGEVEKLNGEWSPLHNGRFYVTSILAGAGYRQPIGDRASMNLIALWNFNESAYSPYTNPVIRGGITFGI